MAKQIEVPVQGMDCLECTRHVQQAIAALPGVAAVDVFLASEKAVITLDPKKVDLNAIRQAIAGAGYQVPDIAKAQTAATASPAATFTRTVLTLAGVVFGVILFVVVAGEWLGLFEALTPRLPWPVGAALVLAAGYPVFRKVILATWRRQIISHTLMTLGVIAALAVGQWATALVVVFFMQVGDYVERFTSERARRAVKDLTRLAPQTARVERDGQEIEVPVSQVLAGETVIVWPGEMIPVDGEVLSGQATLNQASITGEALPVEVGAGASVFAATLAQLGSLRVRASAIGADTTFGRVVRLVEAAEANRAHVQSIADRFSAYYLPVVAGIAALTFLLRRDPLATAAVLVVACSCSFALATPIAMLASIGAGARGGILIKGGKYLELLARADVLLIDKTGTLTLGRPEITDILPVANLTPHDLLRLAASAERYSEHPLARAVCAAARKQGIKLAEPQNFSAKPGIGVEAQVDGHTIKVGSARMATRPATPAGKSANQAAAQGQIDQLLAQGKTLLFVRIDGWPAGLLAATDTLRPEVPQALAEVRRLGIKKIELLTGDNERAAAALVKRLGGNIACRANLLPEDKINAVKEYQAKGHSVIMVGDGVNDAPALAQADVGIAMGAAGSSIAIEAAHVALMREDWRLVPEALQIARRTLRVVKLNIAFTAIYNLAGLSLAALGWLPPIFAAAAQSLPDLGILANSSRLLRQK